MATVIRNIFLGLVLLIGIFCGNKRTNKQLAKKGTVSLFNQPSYSEKGAGTKPALFLSSKKFRIQYDTYGCFHYNSSYIDVEKTNEGYTVTLKDIFSSNSYTSIQLDNGFAAKLSEFAAFYANLKTIKEKQPIKKYFEIGTSRTVSVTGGLENFGVYCENDYDLSGYNKLVNYINQMMIEQ